MNEMRRPGGQFQGGAGFSISACSSDFFITPISDSAQARFTVSAAQVQLARVPQSTPTSDDRTMRERRRRNGPPAPVIVAQLKRLYADRYGDEMPDDDAGHEDVRIMLHHMAHLANRNARKIMHVWLDQVAPWFAGEQRERAINDALSNPHAWKGERLGSALGLMDADRTRLSIRAIPPIDMSKEERARRSAKKEAEDKARRRRAAGCRTRAEIAETSIEGAEPWVAEGISRRTWFRRRERQKQAEEQSAQST